MCFGDKTPLGIPSLSLFALFCVALLKVFPLLRTRRNLTFVFLHAIGNQLVKAFTCFAFGRYTIIRWEVFLLTLVAIQANWLFAAWFATPASHSWKRIIKPLSRLQLLFQPVAKILRANWRGCMNEIFPTIRWNDYHHDDSFSNILRVYRLVFSIGRLIRLRVAARSNFLSRPTKRVYVRFQENLIRKSGKAQI